MKTDADVVKVRVLKSSFRHDVAATWIVCQRELIKWSKDRGRLLAGLVQPVLWLFVLGSGLSAVVDTHGSFNYQTFLFPGAVAISVLFTSIFSGISLVWDREFGFLREMMVAPIKRSSIIIGKCFGGAITATAQGLVMIALGGFVGVPMSVSLVLELTAIVFLMSFAITALGLMMAGRIKQVQSAMPLIQLLITPMMFLSGAMYPIGDLPPWLHFLTRINPLTYAVQPMRDVVFNHLDVSPEIAATFNPGLTWNGWVVPVWLQLLMIVAMALTMLTITIIRFQKID